MRLIDNFFASSAEHLRKEITASIMAYVCLYGKDVMAFDELVKSLKYEIFKDASVQPTNEVSKSETSKKN